MKGSKPKYFGGKKNRPKRIRHVNTTLLMIVGAIIAIFVLCGGIDAYRDTYYNKTRVNYSQFDEELKKGNVNVVYLSTTKSLDYVLFTDKDKAEDKNKDPKDRAKEAKKERNRFTTDYPNYDDFRLDILNNGAIIEFESTTSLLGLAFGIFPVTIMVVFLIMIIMTMRRSIAAIDSKPNTNSETSDKNVKFENIIGLDEIVDDIKFTLKVLTSPDLCEEYKVKPPRGILLSGPPGTGKTMIAKAIANELSVDMISVDSSSLIEVFAGTGAARVRKIFKTAKEKAPCVVFFDELDAIGGKRHSGGSSVDNEYKQVIDAMLQELDGFNSGTGILVIGATNLESHLDEALTRSGRFNKKIIITPPKDSDTRQKMFEKSLEGVDLKNADVSSLAKQSTGLTGADIADICNEAKLIAVAKHAECMSTDILEEAFDRQMFKGNRTKTKKKHDIEITAYHESGHALSMLLNDLPISRISIIPNTSGVGGMVVNSDNDSGYYTKKYIVSRIKACYSGRIAEELIFGADMITTGASSDIEAATKLLRGYVEKFGFDKETGLLDIDSMMRDGYINNQNALNKIHELSRDIYKDARNELEENKDILEKLAKYVLEHETVGGDKIKELFTQFKTERIVD